MVMNSPSNMLWDLLKAQPYDEESIMQCLYDHPGCCSLVIDDKLAIHVAIEQCLSMDIIKQMLKCYLACCSRKNSEGDLLLHDLLADEKHMIPSDVILLIIHGNSEAVRTLDDCGHLPLHIECLNRCRYAVILKLLEVHPDAISRSIIHFPLYLALENEQAHSSDAITYLINAYPKAVSIPDHLGRLPIHVECKTHCRYEVITKLLDIYPDGISIADQNHCYPLHHALTNKHCSSESILYMINLYPDVSCTHDQYGNLPLHMECSFRCRYEVITKLHDIFPDAINTKGNNSHYPLHWSLLCPCSTSEVISYLISLCHDAVCKKDKVGSLPLHIECRHLCRYDVIRKLLDIYPAAISISNRFGCYPLHHALTCHHSSSEVISYLISLCPDVVRMIKDEDGNHPIHIECYRKCRYGVIIALLTIYPEALSIMNNNGILPLHMVLSRNDQNNSVEIISYLIRIYPDIVKVEDDEGDLPLHIECKGKRRYDVIIQLLDIYPDAISIMNHSTGSFPLHLIFHLVPIYDQIVSWYDHRHPPVELIKLIYDRYPNAASIRNHNDFIPLCRVFSVYYDIAYALATPKLSSTSTSPYEHKLSAQFKALFISMVNNYHDRHPVGNNSFLDFFLVMHHDYNLFKRRVLLNLTYLHLLSSSSKHIRYYYALNYQPRSPLLHLIYQLSSSSRHHMISPSSHSIHSINGVLISMIVAAGRMEVDASVHDMKYEWVRRGDDVGCVLLRKVANYL